MKDEYIGEYRLLTPLSNQNAGFSKWGFAEQNGREYFIKELLDPVYPLDNSAYSEKTRSIIQKNCHEYEAQQVRMYTVLNEASDGNLVRVQDFFRFGSRYYVVTEKIDTAGIDMEYLRKCNDLERLQVCLSLCHTLMKLHQAGLVHGDIKPSNILLTRTQKGRIAAKIIDVDTCFLEKFPPENTVGDLAYCAPERIQVAKGDAPSKVLGCKIDVFSLGLLIHEILVGELPSFSADYRYAYDACMDHSQLTVSSILPSPLQQLIGRMIMADPVERCSAQEAFQTLRGIFLSEPFADGSLGEVRTKEKEPESKPVPIAEKLDAREPYVASSGLRMGYGLRKKSDQEPASSQRNINTKLRSAGDL